MKKTVAGRQWARLAGACSSTFSPGLFQARQRAGRPRPACRHRSLHAELGTGAHIVDAAQQHLDGSMAALIAFSSPTTALAPSGSSQKAGLGHFIFQFFSACALVGKSKRVRIGNDPGRKGLQSIGKGCRESFSYHTAANVTCHWSLSLSFCHCHLNGRVRIDFRRPLEFRIAALGADLARDSPSSNCRGESTRLTQPLCRQLIAWRGK